MPPRPTILAVDDEPRGVELVQRILRRVAEVETATSADEAWQMFQQRHFDVVISDQRMPGGSGVELFARIAEVSPWTGRILLTGYADPADAIDAINEGQVHAYLSKPCPPEQLRVTLDSVLARVGLERESQRRELAGADRERRLERSRLVGIQHLLESIDLGEAEPELATRAELFARAPLRALRDFDTLVEEVAHECVEALSRDGIELIVELGAGAQLCLDAEALRWAVGELVANARNALPEGGRLWLRSEIRGDSLVLGVLDDGPGVPETLGDAVLAALVAEPMAAGSGLGLALVRKIAWEHDGALELVGKAPGGAHFELSLPLDPAAERRSPPPAGVD